MSNILFLIKNFSDFLNNLVKSLTAADKLRDLLAQIDHIDSSSSPSDQSSSPKVLIRSQMIDLYVSIS
jgi:hypothetical protein